jgi:nucleoid-associated protein YgaU
MRTNVILAAVIFHFANTDKSEHEPIDSRPVTSDATPKLFDLEPTPEAKPIVTPDMATQSAMEPRQKPTNARESSEQTELPAESVSEHKHEPTPIPDDARQSMPEPEPELEPKPEPQPRAAAVEASSQLYTVQKGDTLYSISKRMYGEGKYWREIIRANEKLISSPQALQLGWELKLPPRDEIVHQE